MQRPLVLLAALAFVVCVGLTGCSGGGHSAGFNYSGTTTAGKTIPVADRKVAGDVKGALLGGGQFDLDADAGHVTVLSFWASWCPPCQTEAPQYDSLYRELKPSGVDFVGLNVKDPNRGAAESFIADNHISYPNVYDENGRSALQLGKVPVLSLPWTVVVDKHSRVAAVYSGPQQPADLGPVLTQLVAES